MSQQITEQQVREFIEGAAASLTFGNQSDRVYVGCYVCIVGIPHDSANWTVSHGNLGETFKGRTLNEALAALAESRTVNAKRKKAEELRRQAQELENQAEAESVAPVAQ